MSHFVLTLILFASVTAVWYDLFHARHQSRGTLSQLVGLVTLGLLLTLPLVVVVDRETHWITRRFIMGVTEG